MPRLLTQQLSGNDYLRRLDPQALQLVIRSAITQTKINTHIMSGVMGAFSEAPPEVQQQLAGVFMSMSAQGAACYMAFVVPFIH